MHLLFRAICSFMGTLHIYVQHCERRGDDILERPLCGILSAEGKMYLAYVRNKEQASEFLKLLNAPEIQIINYCRSHGIMYKEENELSNHFRPQ